MTDAPNKKLAVARMIEKKVKSWRKYETYSEATIQEFEQMAAQLRNEAEQESK